ncbi:MAG: carbamoyl phosphate synthase small subunit [Candidatus Levybacteria bacterium RIFCSPLOWO2_02_FULL_36_8b]|nr:MAG: carbamoyl phosphate synthase small subunit [Candidatus Levybacteria bacterium RIFCSPLOWO2_02_FULL_36_8b]
MKGKLILEDGSEFDGKCFGAERSVAGEVVFSTGMVGYPESLTDPSYTGQVLIATYPLIGSYGVPDKKYWESDSIKVSGLIVSNYIDTPSHFQSKRTLSKWLKDENIPALEVTDTRFLTQKIRDKGTMLGKIVINRNIQLYDPNKKNLVAQVSTKKIRKKGRGVKTIILIDCGAKGNIEKSFLKRGVKVIVIPWDLDPFENKLKFDALFISNGPGDPKMADKTIQTIKKALDKKVPVLGICLGHQLLALAGGGDTSKLKFGHRSQNQPCILEGTKRCFITSQNHGFEVTKIPPGFRKWFTNANDGSNEGIIHTKYPFMSVQFHPEACPGPVDTEWIFDYFLERI